MNSPDVTYTYNADGQQTSMTDATGTTTYRINAAGVVDRVTSPSGQVDYGYAANGSHTTTTYPSGRVVTRTANDSGLVTALNDGSGGDYAFTYGIDDQLETVTYPNGVTTTVDRDVLGQVSSVATANTSGSLFTAAYEHDPDSGLLTSIDESGNAELDQQFTVNDRDRLTGSGLSGAVQWDVDDAGNLVNVRGEEQTFDNADRPLTLTTSTGLTTFGYDGRGNRTSASSAAGTAVFGFDTANRMTSGPDGSIFTFTGDGLRASAQSGGAGLVRDWVWDQSTPVPTLLSDGVREYVYGPGGIPLVDAPIHATSGGTPATYLHTDIAGSVRAGTDSSGDEVWARSFDAYGADVGTWTSPGYTGQTTRLGWHGHYRDDSGLLYVQARVYDPAAGGYISEDPAVDLTGEAYGYANSNPVAFTDQTGAMPSIQDIQGGFGAANEHTRSIAEPALATYQQNTFESTLGSLDSLTLGHFSTWTGASVNKCSWYYNSGKIGTDIALILIPGGGAALASAKVGMRAEELASIASKAAKMEKGGLNLYKWKDATSLRATGWREGDYFLRVPWMGNNEATWVVNRDLLLGEMTKGRPIYETYVRRDGRLIGTGGFLARERALLLRHGWRYDPDIGAWLN